MTNSMKVKYKWKKAIPFIPIFILAPLLVPKMKQEQYNLLTMMNDTIPLHKKNKNAATYFELLVESQ